MGSQQSNGRRQEGFSNLVTTVGAVGVQLAVLAPQSGINGAYQTKISYLAQLATGGNANKGGEIEYILSWQVVAGVAAVTALTTKDSNLDAAVGAVNVTAAATGATVVLTANGIVVGQTTNHVAFLSTIGPAV